MLEPRYIVRAENTGFPLGIEVRRDSMVEALEYAAYLREGAQRDAITYQGRGFANPSSVLVVEVRGAWAWDSEKEGGSGFVDRLAGETLSLERRLAHAVLDGDDATALILADEVIAQRQAALEGKAFVSREEMLETLAICEWNGIEGRAWEDGYDSACPCCGGSHRDGHLASCKLAVVLRREP